MIKMSKKHHAFDVGMMIFDVFVSAKKMKFHRDMKNIIKSDI